MSSAPCDHRAGDGSPGLAVTDFGADIVGRPAERGFHAQVRRRGASIGPGRRNAISLFPRMR